MKTTILCAFGLIAVFASVNFGQTANVGKLKFNGVGLDSTYGQVVKVLGKPLKDPKPTREECVGGREKLVQFNGASVHFMDGPSKNGRTFEVTGFEVTSPRYAVAGIKIGDSEIAVRRRYGARFTKGDDESGANVWTYAFPDERSPGFTNVFFVRGRVVKIASGYTVC